MNKGIGILIPKGFGRKDGQQALQEILDAGKKAEKKRTEDSNAIGNRTDSVFCPANGLYFRKEITGFGKSWYEIHIQRPNDGWRMPTLLEMMQFAKYSIQNNSNEETLRLFENIFLEGPEQSVWVDNRFYTSGTGDGQLCMSTDHKIDLKGKKWTEIVAPGAYTGLTMEETSCYETYMDSFDEQRGLPIKLHRPLRMPGHRISYKGPSEGNSVALIRRTQEDVQVDCAINPFSFEKNRGVCLCMRKTDERKSGWSLKR